MDPKYLAELAVGLGLAGLLVYLAGYFAWKQRHTLRRLRHDVQLTPEDRRYLHRQSVRRLFGSLLMLVLAGFLAGWYLLEPNLEAIKPVGDEPMSEGARDTLRLLTMYWIVALLVFLVVLAIAVVDAMATARFGRRHQKALERDRREMIEEEAARYRRERSEMN